MYHDYTYIMHVSYACVYYMCINYTYIMCAYVYMRTYLVSFKKKDGLYIIKSIRLVIRNTTILYIILN